MQKKEARMNRSKRLILAWLTCLAVSGLGTDFERLLQVDTAVEQWVTLAGYPAFYSTKEDQFRVQGKTSHSLNIYGSDIEISLSPNGAYSALASLQPISVVKQDLRDGTFTVLDAYGDLQFQVVRSTGADLKPLVASVSDYGLLALGDPVKGIIYLYDKGVLLTESQIYASAPDYSMERKLFLNWIGHTLCAVLERPNPVNAPNQDAMLIYLDENGRDQKTYTLPFVNLLDQVTLNNHVIVSGYDYDPDTQAMTPLIVDYDLQGRQSWSNQFFGHELTLSSNGQYLAALSSHELIHVFDLKTNQSQAIRYEHNNQASLGLAINDDGQTAVIRVGLDFFVKQNTYFAQLFFPQTGESHELQLNPRSRKLFQLYSYHDRFYIGTNYEWLEIRR